MKIGTVMYAFMHRIAVFGVSFALLPVYAAALTPAAYGALDVWLTAIVGACMVISMKMDAALYRFLSQPKRQVTQIVSTGLQVVAVLYGVLLVTGGVLMAGGYSLLAAVCWASVASGLAMVLLQIARGMGRMKVFGISSVLGALATVGGTLGVWWWGQLDAMGCLVAVAMGWLVTSGVVVVWLRLWRYVRWRHIDSALRRQMVRYSVPLLPQGFFWWCMSVIDRYAVALWLGLTASGMYVVANKCAAVLFQSCAVINTAAHDMLLGQHDKNGVRQVYMQRIVERYAAMYGAVALGVWLAIECGVRWVLPEEYYGALAFVPLLLLAGSIEGVSELVEGEFLARKKTRDISKTTAVGAVVLVMTLAVGMPAVGVYAACLARVLAYGSTLWLRCRLLSVRTAPVARIVCYVAAPLLLWTLTTWLQRAGDGLVVAMVATTALCPCAFLLMSLQRARL